MQALTSAVVDQYKATNLGVSPRYLAVLEGANYLPCQRHSLKSLVHIGTTGAPLRPEQYGASPWLQPS